MRYVQECEIGLQEPVSASEGNAKAIKVMWTLPCYHNIKWPFFYIAVPPKIMFQYIQYTKWATKCQRREEKKV